MIPILPVDPLRRLAWIIRGTIRCLKDFPAENPTFKAGVDYPIVPNLVRVTWREQKKTSLGKTERVQFSGLETGFELIGDSKLKYWFCEQRLGRHVEIQSITPKDYTFQDLVAHFEIPYVKSLCETKVSEYEAAKERIRCLTKQS